MSKFAHIMVVDDQPEQVDMMQQFMKLQGTHSEGVTNFADFQQAYQSRKPDLIILDISMPDHDAYDYVRWLSDQRHAPPILFMSGVSASVIDTAAAIAQSLNVPVLGQLTKPFRYEDLVKYIG